MVLRTTFTDWRPSSGGAIVGGSGFAEVFSASEQSVFGSRSMLAGERSVDDAYNRRIKAVKEAIGVDLVHPGLRMSLAIDGEPKNHYEEFDRELRDLAARYPDKATIIKPDLSPFAEANARRAFLERRAAEVLDRYDGPWGTGNVAAFAGGMWGTLQDPVNAAATLVGHWSPARAGISGLIWMGVKQGAANAAVELAQQPAVQAWRAAAGLDVSAKEVATDVAAAFGLGFALDAGVRGAIRGVQRGRGLEPRLDADGGIQGWWTPEQALEDAARKSRDETLRKAVAGDLEAMEKLARDTGAIDDPAIRGAIADLKDSDGLTTLVPGVDDGEHLARLARAILHADDPDGHLPPLRSPEVPEARNPSLADDVPAPAGRTATIDGKPATFASVDLKQTVTDAGQFQFKRGGDAEGSTGRLGGVEQWDPVAAGRAVIYQRRDGTLVIADAHQRRSLAMRLADQETVVEAVVLREADGWLPGDVRALAAKKNLQEGSGTVIDAAAIIRERPDIIDKSVPLGSDAMRQARALARLSDEAFAQVIGGVLPPSHAALIADLVPDKTRHASIVAELADADPANVLQARLLLNEIVALPVKAEEQMTLLGVWRIERSLMKERVGVLEAALKQLRTDARVLRLVNREAERIEGAGNRVVLDANEARAAEAAQLVDAIEALATTHGPVSTWLTDAAKAVAEGQPKKRAADAFVRRVGDALERDGFNGLAAAPEQRRLGDGGIDDVRGPEADAQIQRLEQELADDIARTEPSRAQLEAEGQQALFALARRGEDEASTPGLDMSREARLKRAEQMGFDTGTTWYRGARSFDDLRGPIWIADSADYAALFPLMNGGNTAIAPVYARNGRVLDLTKYPADHSWETPDDFKEAVGIRHRRADDELSSIVSEFGFETFQALDLPAVREALSGYYDFIDANQWVAGGGTGVGRLVMDPSNIRSVNAAFDPARSDSPGLMFSLSAPETYTRTPLAREAAEDIRSAVDEVVARLPEGVRARVEDRLVFRGQDIDGRYDLEDGAVYISLASADPVRVARHEEVHVLRNLGLIDDAEWALLTDYARRNDLAKRYDVEGRYGEAYKKMFGDAAPDRLMEETVAEMVADYNGGTRFGGTIDRVMAVVVDFVNGLARALGLKGFRTVADVFRAIESGEIGARAAMRSQASMVTLPSGARVDVDAILSPGPGKALDPVVSSAMDRADAKGLLTAILNDRYGFKVALKDRDVAKAEETVKALRLISEVTGLRPDQMGQGAALNPNSEMLRRLGLAEGLYLRAPLSEAGSLRMARGSTEPITTFVHEWGHLLDNSLAQQGKRAGLVPSWGSSQISWWRLALHSSIVWLTRKIIVQPIPYPDFLRVNFNVPRTQFDGYMAPDIADAVRRVTEAVNDGRDRWGAEKAGAKALAKGKAVDASAVSPYARARAAEGMKQERYYSKPQELFARAFEVYVATRARELGYGVQPNRYSELYDAYEAAKARYQSASDGEAPALRAEMKARLDELQSYEQPSAFPKSEEILSQLHNDLQTEKLQPGDVAFDKAMTAFDDLFGKLQQREAGVLYSLPEREPVSLKSALDDAGRTQHAHDVVEACRR